MVAMVCASAWSVLLQSVCFIQRALQSRGTLLQESDFTDHVKRSTFSMSASVEPGLYSPCPLERKGARTGWSTIGGFGFQTKEKDSLNKRK